MSTRGCIAKPVGDEWAGRYHHFDAYPDGLGATLWTLVQEHGVEWARRTLIDEHPAGWSTINGADWSKPPGYRSGSGPSCYCHGGRAEDENLISSRDEDKPSDSTPLFIEWVYVLGDLAMVVYAHYKAPDGRYRWRAVGSYPWSGPEPKWETVGANA